MGNWFYGFILIGLFLAIWISVQELMVAVLVIDVIVTVFYDKVPTQLWAMIGIVNIIAIAKTLFYKPLSPKYSS